jgi:pimeloyl-ACP methyl ester carboxylesterase
MAVHVTRLGSGEQVVLVHGSLGWGEETWAKQLPLGDEFELIVLDRRGHGRSPGDRGDFERDADDILDLAGGGAHLVGHSYGAVASLVATGRRPELVRSLTVIEPPAFALARGLPVVDALVDGVGRAYAAATVAEYFTLFYGAFGIDRPAPTLDDPADERAAVSSWHERPPWEAQPDLEAIATAGVPTLVVRGGWRDMPRAARERAGAAFGAVCDVLVERLGAQLVEFPEAAHNPQLLGEPFNDRLRRFLGS